MKHTKAQMEQKLKLMAKAKVDMMLGTYKWPDGKAPIYSNGRPRTSNAELLRVGGYAPTYRDPGNRLFKHPTFVNAVRTDMARRETHLATLDERQIGRLTRISNMLLDELELRLKRDPETFSNTAILAAAREYRMAANETENLLPQETARKDKMQSFNSFIANTLTIMNESERERFVGTASEAAEDRVSHLKKLIDHVNLVEEDSDDIIVDAEVESLDD